jgi:hypothetical protein
LSTNPEDRFVITYAAVKSGLSMKPTFENDDIIEVEFEALPDMTSGNIGNLCYYGADAATS